MCIDMRGVYQYISSLQPEPPTITPTVQLIQGEEHYHWMLQEQYDQTIYLGDKEASGRVVLGLFMSMVTKLLRSKYPNQLFYVDHEYKVLKFCADEAIVTITCNKEQHVVFVIEYKPRVSSNLSDQTPFHISETLMATSLNQLCSAFLSLSQPVIVR